MDNKKFFDYIESRGQSGYGAAIMVKTATDAKYSLLIASETAPSVFSTSESFEFDLINSPVTGKIKGKSSLEDKEVEYLLHRDNVYRLEQLKNKTLDFLYVTPDLMGWHFVGTIATRPNDAGADVLRGTYTITPMSADEAPIYNVENIVQETVVFTNSIPDRISVGAAGATVDFKTTVVGATIAVVIYDFDNEGKLSSTPSTIFTSSSSSSSVTFTGTGATGKTAMALCTASATGYASWTTTIILKG